MHIYHAFSHGHRLVVEVANSKGSWGSVIEGAAGGLTASAVIWFLGWVRDWLNRPIFKAMRANIKYTAANELMYFDLFFMNEGKRAFIEPTLNIDGLTQIAVQFEKERTVDPDVTKHLVATWTPEGDKIVYNHSKSLVAGTSFRWTFKVLDKTKLPDVVRVKLMHQNGIEPTVEIDLMDLKT